MANSPTLEEQLRAIAHRIASACSVADSYVELSYSAGWSTRPSASGPCKVTLAIGKPIPNCTASCTTFAEAADKVVAEFLRVLHNKPQP